MVGCKNIINNGKTWRENEKISILHKRKFIKINYTYRLKGIMVV